MPQLSATTEVLLDRELVIYRRERSNVWQCRYKVDGKWQRTSTNERDQTKAKVKAKELMIEAKLAKPEIDKYRPSLVLPDINRQVQDNSPSKEELAIAENLRNSYLQTLEGDYKNFNGFNVTAKNSEAEFPVSFTPSDDEKVALKNALSNFDQEAYFTSRWIRNDKPDIQQIMKDIYLLENSEKAFQKIANETAAKMQEHLIKSTSNIKIKPENQSTFTPENSKSEMDKMASLFFSS